MAKYEDDKFVTITNEFAQIQNCVGMYISSGGSAGALHLFKEMFNNALDECNNPKSPADEVTVTFDESIQLITISDNGRGIPFDHMVDACTKKHAGTKIGELHKFNKESAGCNGVGITVTIAFSDVFIMECFRGKEYKMVSFDHCKLTEHPVEKLKKERWGTTVTFVPSEKFLGDFEITNDDILTWFRHMSYIIHPNIKLKFVSMIDNEIKFERIVEASSLAENVRYFSSELEFEPITIDYLSEELDVSFAFSYDRNLSEDITESYCNYVITSDGGYHEMACKRALIDFLVKAAHTADPDSKYEVIAEDIKKGLIMVVNAKYTNVILGGQTKTKVENKEIVADAKPALLNGLKEYFSTNNTQLNKIISYLRQMAKIRMEAYKIKGIKPPKVMSIFDEADIRDYYGISDRNYKGYKELIITEGDSASGAIRGVRNPKYQAVYTTQGVMKNCAELSFAEIAKSRVPHDLARILGVEIGPNADITNLRFNKIICMQDADADGHNIRSLVCTYLIVTMPQLIEEGRLYSAVPPLYTLSDSSVKKYKGKVKKNFLFDKHEYLHTLNNIIADNVEMCVDTGEEGIHKFSKGEVKSFLTLNRQYESLLSELSKKTAIHPDIIEHVCECAIICDTDKKFKKEIESRFSELKYDEETKALQGSYNYEDYYLILDNIFWHIAEEFMKLLEQNAGLTVMIKNKNDDEDKWEKFTIGQALKAIYGKYSLDVSQRFKGLGEVDGPLLFYTTLNPKIRKLVRLTMEDRKKAMEDVILLHGKKEVDGRKAILLGKDVDIDDIDN